MLQPDITMLLTDEDLGGNQKFTVVRTTRRMGMYDSQVTSVKRFEMMGNIQPYVPIALNQVPEESRHEQQIVIRSTFEFQMGEENGTQFTDPDEIVYLGKRWKITSIK